MIPEAKVKNVIASIYTFLMANYTTTPLQLSGVPFSEEDNSEWVRVDAVVGPRQFNRQVSNGHLGARITVLLNMNVIVKQDVVEVGETGAGNIYRLTEIRDVLADLFRENQSIPVNDHAGVPANQIGTLQCYEIDEQDLGFQEQQKLYIYNITARLFYGLEFEV